jgi:uncharacterized membrane protein
VYALVVLTISVVSFPLLLDRDVGAAAALWTSIRAVSASPLTMAVWGLIVAVLLVIGSLPFFFGLAIVVPILGHSTWHLYRKVVEPPRDLHYARGYSLDEPYATRPPMGRFAGLAVGWVGRRSRQRA